MACGLVLSIVLLGTELPSGRTPAATGAETRGGPIRIGALTDAFGPTPQIVGLRDALAERGYREGTDFVIGVRFAQGDLAGLLPAAAALVELGADIVFASDDNSARAAKAATDAIPIVFAGVGNPLGSGLVESFSRPGGNVTGVTDVALELTPKRLEMFRDVVPGLRRVLLAYDPADAYSLAEVGQYRHAARQLGIVLVEKPVRTEEEARAALDLSKAEVDGIVKARFHSLNIPGFVLAAARRLQLPTMFDSRFWVEQGGLASYGPDLYESGRQAARLVDKILKGTPPSEIPVEVNRRVELTINMTVARRLGLRLSPAVLARVDRLIE